LGADDDESEGTFVHDKRLSDTEWDISTGGKFPSFEMPKNMADFS